LEECGLSEQSKYKLNVLWLLEEIIKHEYCSNLIYTVDIGVLCFILKKKTLGSVTFFHSDSFKQYLDIEFPPCKKFSSTPLQRLLCCSWKNKCSFFSKPHKTQYMRKMQVIHVRPV
jgi:hypothetical protein